MRDHVKQMNEAELGSSIYQPTAALFSQPQPMSLKGQLYSAECHPSPKTMTGVFITFNRDMLIGTQREGDFFRVIF